MVSGMGGGLRMLPGHPLPRSFPRGAGVWEMALPARLLRLGLWLCTRLCPPCPLGCIRW